MAKYVISVRRNAFLDEKKMIFFELYTKNEYLWDIRSTEYKNAINKKLHLQNIALKLDVDEQTVKKIAWMGAT